MALEILRNPHVPAHDPSIANRLCTKHDEARARNNVLEGQVPTLENKRTPILAKGTHLTERVAALTTVVEDLQADNHSYQEPITTLQNDLNHERENLVALRNTVANSQPALPPASFPVPNPERYDGNPENSPCSDLTS